MFKKKIYIYVRITPDHWMFKKCFQLILKKVFTTLQFRLK